MKRILVAFTALTVLAAAPSFADEDLKKGKKTFKKCKACHAVGKGAKAKVGPPLNNIFGRTAGTYKSEKSGKAYKYSKAMKAKGAEGLVWNEETLAKFLKKPKKFIPKTKMAFSGLKKKKIDDLLDYLESFSKTDD